MTEHIYLFLYVQKRTSQLAPSKVNDNNAICEKELGIWIPKKHKIGTE